MSIVLIDNANYFQIAPASVILGVLGVGFLEGEVDQGGKSPRYPTLFGNNARLAVLGVCLKAGISKKSGAWKSKISSFLKIELLCGYGTQKKNPMKSF